MFSLSAPPGAALRVHAQSQIERTRANSARDGMPDMHRWRLYASSEVHHAVFRAAGILGIGRQNVSLIPVDGGMRIDVAALEEALDRDAAAKLVPIALIANAGTVNTGDVDPIAQMVAIARARRWTEVIYAAIANELPVGEQLDEETAIAITEALAGVLANHVEVVLRTLGAPGWERGH